MKTKALFLVAIGFWILGSDFAGAGELEDRYRALSVNVLSSPRPVPFPFSSNAVRSVLSFQRRQVATKPSCFVIDDKFLDSTLGDARPRQDRLAMVLDTTRSRWVVPSLIADGSTVPPSHFFYYVSFLEFYKHFAPECLRVNAPIFRGLSSLAVLAVNYRTDLAVLPDFVEETA